MAAILSLQDVSKTFTSKTHSVHAVRGVSFDVHKGECLAIVGESGSGKSTIANMILGVFHPNSGSIRFEGEILPEKRTAEFRSAIQLVQQNPLSSLNPKRTVGASIRLGLDTCGIGKPPERWSMVENALTEVGLPGEYRKRFPNALSGGQRQRVAMARALVCQARLIVLDEPTSSLDVLVQARVLKLLTNLLRSRNLTYIFITHDLSVVRNIADRVVVMCEGELVESGNTADIFENPRSEYTRRLIGSVPVIDAGELELRDRIAGQNPTGEMIQ